MLSKKVNNWTPAPPPTVKCCVGVPQHQNTQWIRTRSQLDLSEEETLLDQLPSESEQRTPKHEIIALFPQNVQK